MRIAIIEDDEITRLELSKLLNTQGYETVLLIDFGNLTDELKQYSIELVLLDINLPYENGYEVCRKIKQVMPVPIIFVTSRDTNADELKSIQVGGIDFITKPYDTLILLEKIKRALQLSNPNNFRELVKKDCTLDLHLSILKYQEQSIELTRNEFRILYYFFMNEDKVISKEELLEKLWNDAEWQARADKRFNRLMKEAHLRYPAADLDETIYRPERQLDTQTIERLSTCHWIEEGKNLIVTGSSASGKTYLINAFCVTAMKQSKSVKYIKANTLMSEMEQARIKSTNLDYLNKLTKLDLLVIDDFGLMDLDLDKCRDLFEVLDTRDGRKSTVVISQFPVSTWFDMFADNTYADACLTRITDKHHTYRLEMNGINMRETE